MEKQAGKMRTAMIGVQSETGFNPEFTSSVIVAYARAACIMSREGQKGCKTI